MKKRIKFSVMLMTLLLMFALPMIPAAISLYIMSSSDIFLLQKLGYIDDVGRYAVANKISLLLLVLIIGPISMTTVSQGRWVSYSKMMGWPRIKVKQ